MCEMRGRGDDGWTWVDNNNIILLAGFLDAFDVVEFVVVAVTPVYCICEMTEDRSFIRSKVVLDC